MRPINKELDQTYPESGDAGNSEQREQRDDTLDDRAVEDEDQQGVREGAKYSRVACGVCKLSGGGVAGSPAFRRSRSYKVSSGSCACAEGASSDSTTMHISTTRINPDVRSVAIACCMNLFSLILLPSTAMFRSSLAAIELSHIII